MTGTVVDELDLDKPLTDYHITQNQEVEVDVQVFTLLNTVLSVRTILFSCGLSSCVHPDMLCVLCLPCHTYSDSVCCFLCPCVLLSLCACVLCHPVQPSLLTKRESPYSSGAGAGADDDDMETDTQTSRRTIHCCICLSEACVPTLPLCMCVCVLVCK